MIGRDRIVFRGKNDDGDPVEQVVYGTVVADRVDGKLVDFFGTRVFQNYYRLVIPRTLDLSDMKNITVAVRGRIWTKFETPVTPVYDGRGRVRHFEAVVKSN